jgi:hypothetical protein
VRVKFYKGPLHGKVRNIDPRTISRGTIQAYAGRDFRKGAMLMPHDLTPMVAPSIQTCTYVMKMMGVTIDGKNYQAPAMHPDGSLFFVYEGTV